MLLRLSRPLLQGTLLLSPVVMCFPAGGGTGAATQAMTATIAPGLVLSAPAGAVLTHSQNNFSAFQSTLALNYEARTTPTGSGRITLQVTSDFAPTGGPSAAKGTLTYTCAGATLGTACSGSQTASTTAQTPVLTVPASSCTGGGGACSAQDPNTMNLTFTLVDDPAYQTGSYSATITFTISAT